MKDKKQQTNETEKQLDKYNANEKKQSTKIRQS